MMGRAVFWEEISRTAAIPPRDFSVFGPMVGPLLLGLQGAQRRGVPAARAARRKDRVLRPDRARCRVRPGRDADPRRARRQRLRDIRRQTLGSPTPRRAGFAQLMAMTDPAAGVRGISCFLVDMHSPGVRVTAQYDTVMGDRPCEVVFDAVRVPRPQPRRPGGGRLQARAALDHRWEDPTARRTVLRRGGALPGADVRLREAAPHLRRTARQPPGRAIHDRRYLRRTARRPRDGPYRRATRPGRRPTHGCKAGWPRPTARKWAFVPPIAACRSTAGWGSAPTCRSSACGANSEVSSSPKEPPKSCAPPSPVP